jgi:hypothetical protein
VIAQHDLISREYCESQRIMHANPRGYGGRGDHWKRTVLHVARRYAVGSILDYGAGRGRLGIAMRAFGFVCRDYDPAIPGWDDPPSFADLVTCCDVMEHVEPDKIDTVLAHIRALARKAAFFVVATRPANKLLPNGYNAHLTIESGEWWEARILRAGFALEPPVFTSKLPTKMPGKCWYAVMKP